MNKILLMHQRALSHFLAKHPDQIDRVNSILQIGNLGYIPKELRSSLIAFVNHCLNLSYKTDGLKPINFGEQPKPIILKPQIVYKDRVRTVEKIVVKEVVVEKKPTLPKSYPVLTEVVKVAPKLVTEGTKKPQERRSPVSTTSPDTSRIKRKSPSYRPESLEQRRARCSRQMSNSRWYNNGVTAIRISGTAPVPEGFGPGMMPSKEVDGRRRPTPDTAKEKMRITIAARMASANSAVAI
jgi:hypothetical protein